MLKIYQEENKEDFSSLLLLADEEQSMIDKYLKNSTMFVLKSDEVIGEICVLDVGGGILEIKNLAIAPQHQRKGYGKMLIDFVCSKYKNNFDFIQVGTGDSPITISFYQKCGFAKSHIVKNFFKENYSHPIVKCGKTLCDMVYLKKKL